MGSNLPAALALAARGFRILPLYDPGPKGKRPRIDDWQKLATTDPATIAQWWAQFPSSNVGIATGGPGRLIAIDVDGQKGGAASWAELEAGRAVPTLTSLSGSGAGCHRIYRVPEAFDVTRIRNAIEFRPGLDVRAAGGQIAAPPSVHESGNRYEWLDESTPIADMPQWLYDAIATDAPAEREASSSHTPRTDPPLAERKARALIALSKLPAAVSGQGGHVALLRAASAVYPGYDLPRADARELLVTFYNPRCTPPWSAGELEHKLDEVEKGATWGAELDAELFSEPARAPEPAKAGTFAWISGPEIAAPLPPTRWCVPGLQICAGRPTLLAGYGFSGKTLAGQSLLVALATDRLVWSLFQPGEGRVVRHLDYEQGRHATIRRYQRIAVGMGVDLAELGTRLGVAVFPALYLNAKDAVDAYARVCEGADLVLLDALRGATPGEDENDSKIRLCIDNLTRVSEKTGAAFIVVHHAGKGEGERAGVRGSSAIFDGCGCVLTMTGEKGTPKIVSQQKGPAEAEGDTVQDFELAIEDVEHGGSSTAGVRVTARYGQVVQEPTPDAKFQQLLEDVVQCVEANPGVHGKGEIAQRTSRNLQAVGIAVDVLSQSGRIVNCGTPSRPRLYTAGTAPSHLVTGDAD